MLLSSAEHPSKATRSWDPTGGFVQITHGGTGSAVCHLKSVQLVAHVP